MFVALEIHSFKGARPFAQVHKYNYSGILSKEDLAAYKVFLRSSGSKDPVLALNISSEDTVCVFVHAQSL